MTPQKRKVAAKEKEQLDKRNGKHRKPNPELRYTAQKRKVAAKDSHPEDKGSKKQLRRTSVKDLSIFPQPSSPP
eukprot:9141-Eustigmatos_ZCMA.PRE.1